MTVGYLTLARSVAYVRGCVANASAARWGRRHLLPNVPHFRLPNSGPVFRIADLDRYMEQYRVALKGSPRDLNAIVREAVPERKRGAR